MHCASMAQFATCMDSPTASNSFCCAMPSAAPFDACAARGAHCRAAFRKCFSPAHEGWLLALGEALGAHTAPVHAGDLEGEEQIQPDVAEALVRQDYPETAGELLSLKQREEINAGASLVSVLLKRLDLTGEDDPPI